jgi:tetratricopeptide (TPR) repeat protein
MVLLGHVYLETEKYEKARKIFQGMAELYPEDNYSSKALAYLLIKLHKYEEAIQHAEKYVNSDSLSDEEMVNGMFLKAHALWGAGRLEECKAAVDKFIELRQSVEADS